MKRLFFLLLLANLLLFLGARFIAPPPQEQPEMRSGGNIRFLTPGQLESYRSAGGRTAMVEDRGETPPTVSAADTEAAFQERLRQALNLGQGECLSLGPLETPEEASTLANELAGDGMAGIVRTEVGTQIQNYLVVIHTRSSVDAASMVKKLRAAGHSDVWWLTTGDHKDEVSVGIFRSRDNAETRKAQMTADGFDTEIIPREVESKSYWIDLRESASRQVTAEIVEKLRARFSTLGAERKRCTRSAL